MSYKMYREPIEARDGNWWVSDLYAAAFFMARGSECAGAKPTSDKQRTAFVIKPREEFDRDLADWNSNGTVGVRDLQDAIHLLKALLRDFVRPEISD